MISAIRKFIRNNFLLFNKLRLAIRLIACLFYVCVQPAVAQVCNDQAGEVLINQTFGVAGSPISITALTTYDYEPISCPGDGQYAVLASLDGTCFNSTWYAVFSDHTSGNTQGNMLVVNGGNKPGTFYQQPVSGLCQGTSYEISFWAMNLLRTNTCLNALVPNLSINIETPNGLVIQSTAIGLIEQTDTPTWRRCSAFFTAPTTTKDFIIKLINKQGDYGCGNDMAIDDFQVKQCGECADKPEYVYVPDAFTPNNDGINDKLAFFLKTSASNSFQVTIFNRWGNLIFTSQDPADTWDGTFFGIPCPSDTYTWIITRRSATLAQSDYSKTGRVLLIR